MTAPAIKAPRQAKPKEKLTLRDATDLSILVSTYIEDHVDEIELNGGALPDDLAKLLDEIDAATAERVDAVVFKIEEFTANAAAAKAIADHATRRRKVHDNAAKALKAYAFYQVQRSGGTRLEGTASVLRIQNNGQASTECSLTPDELLTAHDQACGAIYEPEHPLAKFIKVARVASLDMKALVAAYDARRDELAAEAEFLGEADISDEDAIAIADFGANTKGGTEQQAVVDVLATMRANYIRHHLAAEFPGVTSVRGQHLRID
jgi:hypothetical protein